MWFHSDNSSYGAAMVGVATSKLSPASIRGVAPSSPSVTIAEI